MSDLVPEGWKESSIGEITSTNSLFSDGDWVESKDQDPAGTNRLIQLADIGDGVFINKSSRYMNDEQFQRLKCTSLKKNDILIARMPDPLGRACLYPLESGKAATVVDVAILRTENSDHYWLMSAINSSNYRYQIDLNASGTTRTRIARGILSEIEILEPPLPEQQKIATILSSVDDVIEKTRAQIDKLKDLKTGMMQELLTKGIGHTEFKDSPVGRIPTAWKVMPLGSICDLEVGYAFKSSWFSDSGVRLLRGDNVGYGQPTWERIHYLPEEQSKTYSKYLLAAGDVIIGMDRTFTKSGVKVTKLRESDAPALLVQRVGKFLPKKCTKEFLWQLVRSPNFTKALKNQEKGMDIPHLSKTEILEPTVAVPSLGEQADIAKILDSQDVVLDSKQKKLTHLEQIKKALMQDLLTGKVRVNLNESATIENA